MKLLLSPLLFILFDLILAARAIPLLKEKNSGTNWAVLVAGSNGWDNYRHQADVCHAYHVLINNGFKPEHIITLMYDDIAYNENNPFPGKIFNEPNGKDVYKGVKIDYSGNDVNTQVFMNVLKGNKTGNAVKGTGRVLQSLATDNIFVYYSDHGGFEILGTPNYYFGKIELYESFDFMHKNHMYKNLLFYLEACDAGSMFNGLNPEWNIYAITASSEEENSWASCETNFAYLCDHFSINWMRDSENHNINAETVGKQFNDVKIVTTSSTVSEYGKRSIRSDFVAYYQGSNSGKMTKTYNDSGSIEAFGLSVNSRDVSLLTMKKLAIKKGMDKVAVDALMQDYIKKRDEMTAFVKETFEIIVRKDKFENVLSMNLSNFSQNQCHSDVIRVFDKLCAPFGQNPYAFKFSIVFANLCEITKNQAPIIDYFNVKCNNGSLFVGVI